MIKSSSNSSINLQDTSDKLPVVTFDDDVNAQASKAQGASEKFFNFLDRAKSKIKGPVPGNASSHDSDTVFRGRFSTKTTIKTPISRWQRVGYAIGKVVPTALGVGAANIVTMGDGFKKIVGLPTLKKFAKEVADGAKIEETYAYQGAEPIGRYNPKDRASLKTFIKENKNMLYESNGHYYFLDKGRSSIILLPNLKSLKDEDIDANDEICSLRFWDPDSGKPSPIRPD